MPSLDDRTDAPGHEPRVSVVMSLLSPQPAFLKEAVESVLAQDFDDFELVILEDPNPDYAGAATIESFDDPRVRYLRNDERVPLAASRRRTLQEARGEFVAIMDGDDRCDPRRLAEQVDFFDRNTNVDVVGTQLEVIDAAGTRLGYRSYPRSHDDIERAMRRYNPLAHPSVMLRREAALAAGSYRDRDGAACDDYELWSRMANEGFRFANLPSALLRYRIHGSSMKSRLLRATLRDTIDIKRTYFGDELDFGDRLRILGETALQWIPARLVTSMFLRAHLQDRLPEEAAR